VLHDTDLRGEGLLVTWKTLKDGLVLLVDSELLIVDAQLYCLILAALPCCTGGGFAKGLANAHHHPPVVTLATGNKTMHRVGCMMLLGYPSMHPKPQCPYSIILFLNMII
jgi:hypothetical protein